MHTSTPTHVIEEAAATASSSDRLSAGTSNGER